MTLFFCYKFSNQNVSSLFIKRVQIINATLLLNDEEYVRMKSGVFGNFPNGFYKIGISFYDDIDDNIAQLIYIANNHFYDGTYDRSDFKIF